MLWAWRLRESESRSAADDNQEWTDMCKRMQVRTIWSDPTDKRSDGFAEQAVKMIELTGKSIMASNATPSNWWEPCWESPRGRAEFVRLKKKKKSGVEV